MKHFCIFKYIKLLVASGVGMRWVKFGKGLKWGMAGLSEGVLGEAYFASRTDLL
jgi:hypothetical protein